MDPYKDKIVIVTGAGSGIGRALCECLAGRGALVIAADIDPDKAGQTTANITDAGGRAVAQFLDVTDAAAFDLFIEQTIAMYGRIDYLFNNAGIVTFGELQDLTVDLWHKVIDVNLHGVFNGTSAAYKQMARQCFGHIVNLSSIEGLMPFPGSAPYVASKYAVLGLTQALWVEGGHFGVKASAVCPGFIRTAIFDSAAWVNIDAQKAMAKSNFFEKFSISPEKCARVILKGVAKNKAIIPVTFPAHLLWRLMRIAPVRIMKLVRRDFDKWRTAVRLSPRRELEEI